MVSLSMVITRGLKEKLARYGANLPVDKRTRAYAKILKDNNWTAGQYVSYLKETVTKLKKKEDKKIKTIIKEVENAKIKKEVQKKVSERNMPAVRYVGSINLQLQVIFINENNVQQSQQVYKIISFDKTIKSNKLTDEISNTFDDVITKMYENDEYKQKIKKINVVNVEHSLRLVKNDTSLNSIRMRKSGTGLIDGYDKQTWDTNTGRCVFDYIINRYGNIKGFKNVCTYNNLNGVFNNVAFGGEEKDLLTIGVNTEEIQIFCERYRIPMYALDDNEKCFKQYTPINRNKNCPAMIYRLSNEHFYPCPLKKTQSIIQTTSIINNIDSVMVRDNFKVQDEEEQSIEYANVEYVDDVMNKLIETITEGKIPEKITMVKRELYGFKYGNDTFVSNENIDLVKKLCDNMNKEYSGQTLGSLLKIIVQEATGNETLPKSTHNPYVFDTLINAKKNRARIGTIADLSCMNDTDLRAFDITKCYSSCLYTPSEDWIITDYNDTWEDYQVSEQIKLGLYYVITEDTKLFKKSGYYSTAFIKKAIEEGIDFKITKQLISKHSQSKDLFKKVIDKVLKYCNGDVSMSKLVINLMSGLLGQSEKEGTRVKINSDMKQMFNFLDKYYSLAEGIMINQIPNTDYFIYGFNKKIKMNETNIPMFIQMLDESNIKLYDMIKNVGCELVACKVDCCVVRGCISNIPTNTTENPTDLWGTYRECDVPTITRVEECKPVDFTSDNDWIEYKYEDSDEWEDIMEVLEKKKGLLLQASAGNGKTYVAKQIAQKLKEKGFGVRILAPTNKAALNIGGTTIHKFLKMTKDGYINPKFLKTIKDKYQYIIVDEISMITKDLWKRLCLLKMETDITFLLLGDEKQCPPVEDEDIEDYFNHPAVKYICNYNKNVLDVRKRYDEQLYNILKNVDDIKIGYVKEPSTQRNICFFNRTRIIINKYWNDKLKKEGDLFISENDNDEQTQDMYIYEGLPIIAKKTKRDGDNLLFANSETFNVGNIDDEYISVYCERPDENGEKEMYIYDCPKEEFKDYFLMNYCSTTHKSQGETITENYTIYDWKHMTTKIKYTALSRAKNYEQVSFGIVEYQPDISRTLTFEENINKKLKSHLEYDTKKRYTNNITCDDIQTLFVKQNGECLKCGEFMKTCGYGKGDKKQFSIDRIDSKKGHTKDNIQLCCWCCNRSKKNRF